MRLLGLNGPTVATTLRAHSRPLAAKTKADQRPVFIMQPFDFGHETYGLE